MLEITDNHNPFTYSQGSVRTQHLKYIRQLTSWKLNVLVKNYIFQQSDEAVQRQSLSTFGASPYHIDHISQESYKLNGSEQIIRRVYLSCEDSGEYCNVGWVLNGDAANCMNCQLSFNSFLAAKHHCRACGNVVCDNCSQGRSIVQTLENEGEVRVCNMCYYGQCPVLLIKNRAFGESIFTSDREGNIICKDLEFMSPTNSPVKVEPNLQHGWKTAQISKQPSSYEELIKIASKNHSDASPYSSKFLRKDMLLHDNLYNISSLNIQLYG
jgi:hypothetical protein